MGKRLTHEEFIERVQKIKPTVEVLSEYKGAYEKVYFRCKICGHEWEAQANSMLKGLSGCRKCAGSLSYSNEEFLQKLKEVNENIIPLEEYTKNNIKIELECKICGHKWRTTPNKLLSQKTGCPKCAGQVSITTEDFINKMKKINPDIKVLEEFRGVDTKIKVKCNICGNIWEATPSHLKNGEGCPVCARNKLSKLFVKEKQKFIKEMEEIDPTIKIVGEYKNSKTKIKCKCKDCRYEWEALPSNLLRYRGCPSCSMSKGEKFIKYYLEQNSIDFEAQKRFPECKNIRELPFDFYLPKYNCCIEFDGQQHYAPATYFVKDEEKAEQIYKDTKARDLIKDNFCREHKIFLLRIPYWKVNNISEVLNEFLRNLGRI